MHTFQRSVASLRVTDLVLDPFTQSDALQEALRQELLTGPAIHHLSTLLPVAIAQLDALDDDAGALALDELYEQLHVNV